MAESEDRSNSNAVLSYTPIIPKVDTTEDSVLENEKNETKTDVPSEFKICSPMKQPNVPSKNSKTNFLKAPQLNLPTSSTTPAPKTFTLNPPKLKPIVKNSSEDSIDKKDENSNGEPLKFVPLLSDNKTEESKPTVEVSPVKPSTTISTTSFVFGQNLQERVITQNHCGLEDTKPSTSENTNGTSDMLFSNAIRNVCTKVIQKDSKSLSESAKEYEQSRPVKRKFDEVEVKTGEEEEANILCISCKLFAFDGDNWQERGRGTLRLNDFQADSRVQSRLVFRTSGSLRVVLNTKIFAKMTAEKASDKSTRITALDANGEIKVFLVMASIEDSKVLLKMLEQRIKLEIEGTKENKS